MLYFSVLESAVHLVKGCLGGGIMGIHCAYQEAGLWTAVVFSVLFGIYITYCIWVKCLSYINIDRKYILVDTAVSELSKLKCQNLG